MYVVTPQSYRCIRWLHGRQALRTWVKTRGAFLLVALAVAGAGGPALLAGTVAPLLLALEQRRWLLPAMALYLLVGAGLVLLARAALWPSSWAEMERCLPLRRVDLLRADLAPVAVAALPQSLVLVGGALVWWHGDPPWLRPHWHEVPLALAAVGIGSVCAGALVLGVLRHRSMAKASKAHPDAAPVGGLRRLHWITALFWLPLSQSETPQTTRTLLLGAAMLASTAVLAAWQPQILLSCLFAFTALAMVLVSRLNTLSRQEWAAMFEMATLLPLRIGSLQRVRASMAMSPALFALLLWLGVVASRSVHLVPLTLFVCVSIGSWAWEVASEETDPATRAARWFFGLALAAAAASEVLA